MRIPNKAKFRIIERRAEHSGILYYSIQRRRLIGWKEIDSSLLIERAERRLTEIVRGPSYYDADGNRIKEAV